MTTAFSIDVSDRWSRPEYDTNAMAFEEGLGKAHWKSIDRKVDETLREMDQTLSTAVTIVGQRTDWLAATHRRLAQISKLTSGWNSYSADAPNAAAIGTTRIVLSALAESELRPSSVDPSAEGGVCVSFRRGANYADIECFNTGEIFAITSRGPGTASAWRLSATDADLDRASKIIRRFLGR